MRLSAHFFLRELTRSQLASRHALDNTPNAVARDNLKRLCLNILEPLRVHYARPIHPSSGYRSRPLNRLLGSSDRSQHCRGEAVDFEIAGIANLDLAKHIAAQLEFDQLILEYPQIGLPHAGWVHVSFNRANNRKTVMTRTTEGFFDGLNNATMRVNTTGNSNKKQ